MHCYAMLCNTMQCYAIRCYRTQAPKTASEGARRRKRAPRRPKTNQEAPKSPQEAPNHPPRGPQEALRSPHNDWTVRGPDVHPAKRKESLKAGAWRKTGALIPCLAWTHLATRAPREGSSFSRPELRWLAHPCISVQHPRALGAEEGYHGRRLHRIPARHSKARHGHC